MAEKVLAGRKILMVIAPNQFRDEELLVPKKVFENEGAKVVIASTQVGEARGMLGAKVKPDLSISDVNPAEYAGVVVVGGMGSPEHLWDNADLHDIIGNLNSEKKLVAAICLSGAVLAKANVLETKKATVWPDPKAIQVMKDKKANYCSDHVVQDGHIVTADGPESAEIFAQTCLHELSKVRA